MAYSIIITNSILVLILYFIYKTIIYPYYFSPYAALPRPSNAFQHWIQYLIDRFKGKINVHLDLILKYGPVVHLENNFVLVHDPKYRKIYLTYKYQKDEIYSLFDLNGPNLFSSRDRGFHSRRKKLVSSAFSVKGLGLMEGRIASVGSESLVNYLNQNLMNEEPKEFDLFKLFHYNTLDAISELIFGKNLNTTTDSQSAKFYFEGIEKTQKLLFMRLLVPFSSLIRLPMESMFKPIILDNIQKRRSTSKVHYDILQSLIDARDPDSGEGLKDFEIVDECLVLLFAGMDTTANTMTWTLYEILKHSDIYELVRNEILEKFPNLNEPISYDSARNELEYFEACVLESMRKNPVGAGPMPRVVPEGGLTVNGYYLPPKTVIAMDIYSQHNDPSVWPNPSKFNISRWLGSNRESNKSKLLSFGLGPTSCVGRELAWMEIYLVLTELIRNFELELVDKELTHNLQFLNKPLEKRLRVRISKRIF